MWYTPEDRGHSLCLRGRICWAPLQVPQEHVMPKGHLCFRTRKLPNCHRKPDMCIPSSLELLVDCPFRDMPEFPAFLDSSQLPVTLCREATVRIPTLFLVCSLQPFHCNILYISLLSFLSFHPHSKLHRGNDFCLFCWPFYPSVGFS